MSNTSTDNNNNADFNIDVDRKTRALTPLYAKAREKMRETAVGEPPNVSFTLTTEQAIKEVLKGAKEEINRLRESLIKSNPEVFGQLREFENDSPEVQVKKIDENIIVPFLKQVQQNDPTFEQFKLAYHSNDPEKFDELLADLKRKGLMD